MVFHENPKKLSGPFTRAHLDHPAQQHPFATFPSRSTAQQDQPTLACLGGSVMTVKAPARNPLARFCIDPSRTRGMTLCLSPLKLCHSHRALLQTPLGRPFDKRLLGVQVRLLSFLWPFLSYWNKRNNLSTGWVESMGSIGIMHLIITEEEN